MAGELFLQAICCIIIGYFIGCLSPSYVIGKRHGYDVRESGSGNAGASNVVILAGKVAGLVVALADIFKAVLAWKLCRKWFMYLKIAGVLGGVACVLGHMFPVFLGFRGGKGLACLGGLCLANSPKMLLAMLCVAVAIGLITNYICVVTVSMSVIFPIYYGITTGDHLGSSLLLLLSIPIFIKIRKISAVSMMARSLNSAIYGTKRKNLPAYVAKKNKKEHYTMKKVLALTLVLCLALSLCACGKKEEQKPQEVSFTEPEANVNPTFINWGNQRNDLRTSDPWYTNGQIGDEFIYFSYGESSAGIVYYHEKAGSQLGYAACAMTEDMHLVTEGEGTDIDIIFPSDFHAYDLKTETWYIRANPEFMSGLFVGKNFAEHNDPGNTLVFNADGTAKEVYQGTDYEGTWKIINATTVRFTISEEEYYDFELILNGDNTLQSLSEYNNRSFTVR